MVGFSSSEARTPLASWSSCDSMTQMMQAVKLPGGDDLSTKTPTTARPSMAAYESKNTSPMNKATSKHVPTERKAAITKLDLVSCGKNEQLGYKLGAGRLSKPVRTALLQPERGNRLVVPALKVAMEADCKSKSSSSGASTPISAVGSSSSSTSGDTQLGFDGETKMMWPSSSKSSSSSASDDLECWDMSIDDMDMNQIIDNVDSDFESPKHGYPKINWNDDDHKKLMQLQKKFGNKWKYIAEHFPGRTRNNIKNRWYTAQRRVKRLDSFSEKPKRSASSCSMADGLKLKSKLMKMKSTKTRKQSLIATRSIKPKGPKSKMKFSSLTVLTSPSKPRPPAIKTADKSTTALELLAGSSTLLRSPLMLLHSPSKSALLVGGGWTEQQLQRAEDITRRDTSKIPNIFQRRNTEALKEKLKAAAPNPSPPAMDASAFGFLEDDTGLFDFDNFFSNSRQAPSAL